MPSKLKETVSILTQSSINVEALTADTYLVKIHMLIFYAIHSLQCSRFIAFNYTSL